MATRTPLTRLLALLTTLLLAFVVAACDNGPGDAGVEDDPEGALRDALEELADYQGFELLLQLSADDAARAQAISEGDISEDDLETLLTSSVLIRASGADGDEGAAEFVVTIDDAEVAELRILPDMDLYVRIDLDAIFDLVDDPDARAQVQELASAAEMFGMREIVDAVEQGEWIRITGLEQMLNLFGVSPQTDEVDEDEADRLSQELSDAAIRFVDQDVTVTHVGSDDVGERVRATTNGAALSSFLDELGAIAASSDALGGANAQDLTGEFDDIPDDLTVSLDAWISNGRLTQIAIDLADFDDEGEIDGELLLVIGISEFTGSIGEPDEATEFDLFGLLGGFMGGMGGGFGDDAFDDDAFDEGAFDDDFDAGEACLTEEELDQMRAFLDPDEQAELDQAIEMGALPVC